MLMPEAVNTLATLALNGAFERVSHTEEPARSTES